MPLECDKPGFLNIAMGTVSNRLTGTWGRLMTSPFFNILKTCSQHIFRGKADAGRVKKEDTGGYGSTLTYTCPSSAKQRLTLTLTVSS